MDKLKRYIIFLIGLFINSLGVSLITKAALGTSPISSIPYVLSLIFPFTLGQFTIYFSVLLVVLQLLILRRKFKIEHLLQIPISIIFCQSAIVSSSAEQPIMCFAKIQIV